MLDRIIMHSQLMELVDELAHKRRVIGPVAREVPECDPPVRHFYEEVQRARQLDLAFRYCVYSPKQFLLPPRETLFAFERGDGFTTEDERDDRPTVLVGVHPCDIHAIRLYDRVFNLEYRDEHYFARRDATMIIGLDCSVPCTDGVFCKDMGAHEADVGFDVMLYPLEKKGDDIQYGVMFGTRAGREWLVYSRQSAVPTADDERRLEKCRAEKESAFSFALHTRREELPELLGRSYDSLLWDATARRCYSCGSCNLSCPTCYCFDMADEGDLGADTGRRIRKWDGCQLPGFALVAGDHNFREKAASRLRHRIYRKAVWIQERSGAAGCVGCARCDRACTAKISSVEIYNQLAEEV